MRATPATRGHVDSCDALVVGGGPAGSTCARSLKQAGLDVLVLDKSEFPRDKVCAGWITPQVIESLVLDTDDYRRGRVFQPITAFVTGLGTGRAVSVTYDHAVSYGIRRYEFDDYLLRRSGARLALGEPLATLERQGDGWLVNGRIRTPLVIGAGGHFCPVARSLGAAVGRDEPAITAQEIEFEMTPEQLSRCRVTGEQPELYFCDDLKGYGWCFRKGNFLNIGLGREENHALAKHLATFWDWLASEGKIPAGAHPRFKGHAYLLRPRSPRSVVDGGVLLIGDAAGLAYAQSGEGIRPAVESGLMAAQTVLAAGGDFSRARLASYEAGLAQRFGPSNAPAAPFGPPRLRERIARALLRTRWFARHVVLNRWFLHANEPALALR
jgi:geranylgeranyl reductase family protein